ncbi:Guanine nucleotide exchange factor for Cdc42p [Vermiconidia calcicola]|uniref:Guanine nucleotide exchange factor for Cdc42p n=1 Tax=Vermiconidia calcicola TaxID=1690605 RepID=A0ACC3N7U0_9PEZI|nr:Guanine nucleotide exchange factor for Cdc42p [Vermiconidia calcicola]
MEVASSLYMLQRTQTAPISSIGGGGGKGENGGARHFSANSAKMPSVNGGHNSLAHSQAHTSSNYSIQSQPSSRSSDTTQGTTSSTLFPPPPMPSNAGSVATNGDDIKATDNIMNTVADASSSLFQICVTLRQRLMGVPGFGECLERIEEDADEDTDPVTVLWRTFREGYPLMLLYNTLRPDQPLSLPANMKEEKRGKAATFKFIHACLNDLKFMQEEMFIVTDLYNTDTTGIVKVAKVVNRVLDILVQRGLVEDVRPTARDFEQAEQGMKRTQRQHIVSELVRTERTYVQHLELLQALKNLIEEKGMIAGDVIHDIFFNLNSLLDFQRRFLIRVEQTNNQPEQEQNWGRLFRLYNEAFQVYEPYIANQRRCERAVVAEFPKLAAGIVGGSLEMRQIVESPTALCGFLMKPFQRLTKYPLLLEELYKRGDLDEDRRQDLLEGKRVATEVLARTNKAVDREEKAEAVQELKVRVEDWKGHRVEGFGELLLYGTFTVLKSENLGSGKDGERQYHVYLFETILLCCKDIDLSKPKNKYSSKQLVDKRGKPKLQLKGRIFMQNVTDLISMTKPGSYTSQIFWKGDPSIENFIIRFPTEDMMRKWTQQVETQRRRYRDRSGRASDAPSHRSGDGSGQTSATEFVFMKGKELDNPYAGYGQEEEDEEEDDVNTLAASQSATYPYNSSFEQSRNGSSTSLRSRSTTGESGITAVSGRQAAPRLPPGTTQQQPPSLALRTRELIAQSPGEFAPESYFSPLEGSPNNSISASTRTSASSGMYPFPRQQMQQNGYYEEGHGHGTRFTAPAIARQREVSGGAPPNGYPPGPVARSQRPSVGMHSAQQMPGGPRNRSASSPDIHNNANGRGPMRGQGPNTAVQTLPEHQEQRPPMPDMPVSYQQYPHMVPRSQSNSPSLSGMVNGVPQPQRGASPHMQRERGHPSQQQQQRLPPEQRGPSYTARAVTPVLSRVDTYTPPPPSLQQQSTAPAQMQQNQGSPIEAPTQLKVRVHCEAASQTLTLVVPLNISYQSIKDRIDAKLQRSTHLTLSERGPREGQVKLKYLDEDDFVSIQSDDDVQTAFETWKEQNGGFGNAGGTMGEIDLYCR